MSSNLLRLAVVTAVVGAACAGEREPINRVQPWALDKTFFVGNDLASSHDDPEFWGQGTLVDVGYGASQDGLFTSTYAQPLTRIKWDIQEDKLIARLTYELIEDSDGKGSGPTSTDGQVVAVYRIEKHFDIQREYNSSTGEEINVIGENASDRPWYERRHFRVDWSQNLFTDAYDLDTLSMLGIYGSVKYEPVAFTIKDPESPDAPHFDVENGYFDVTNKVFARPGMIDLTRFGWGMDKFPACWLDNDFMAGSAPSGNCNPVELTLRQSYRRVENTGYEPGEWDGHRFKAYGAFTTERKGYARNYGMSDAKWHRFINRYNIWQESHYYADPATRTGAVECFTPATTPSGADPHRDENLNGTEDECETVGRGSRCDTFNQKCTLPFRDRQVAPITWYYSEGSDPNYFESSDLATREWDVAMRTAVVTARYAECKRVGADNCDALYPVYRGQMDDASDALALAREVDDCRRGRAYLNEDCNKVAARKGAAWGTDPAVVALAQQSEMIVLCHSPTEADDPEACQGPRLPADMTAAECQSKDLSADKRKACRAAFSARKGDIRYHQLNVISTPQTPSPWGIMVDAIDPLTGETVAASINVWSHVTDLWSQSVIDLARYVKGELTTADVTEGTYIHDWARASEAATTGGMTGRLTKEQLDERIAGYLGLDAAGLEHSRELWEHIEPSLKGKLMGVADKARDIRADALAPSTSKAVSNARRNRAVGSDFEAQFSRTAPMQQLAGVAGMKLSDDTKNALASPFRTNDLRVIGELRSQHELALSERGACIMRESPLPVGIAALSDMLEEKFGAFNPTDSKEVQLERAEKMRKWIAFRAHSAVMSHEIGHSIGLRHNFVSSSDSYNYRPQYWQLRTDDGQNVRQCTGLEADGACVGPRYFDPVNTNERDNLQWMFMQSSVMDYAGETLQDLVGLGAYDFAATRMFYGDTVAVHTDASYRQTAARGAGVIDKMDDFGGILGFQYQAMVNGELAQVHYSQLQKNYELIKDCIEVDPQLYKPANWNEARDGVWSPVVDGFIVQVGGKWTRCRQQPVDYVGWDLMKDVSTGRGKSHAVDSTGRTRVPYGFATDRWADLGNLSVYRHDNGADPYELFDFLITQQEVNHIFDNYRRGKMSFSVRSAAGRTLNRYNTKMRDAAKGLGLLVNIYRDFALEIGYDFDTLWPALSQQLFGPNILASGIAFDHFARQLQRPQAGVHFLDNGIMRSTDDAYANHDGKPSVTVPNGATGYFQNIGFGGRPLENSLARDRGEYDSDYTLWAGSYYDKAYTSMLLTESVDNFVSSSRNDFLDARFRAVSLADVFPEGYRRWLANNLTGDDFLKGARVEATAAGVPVVDADGYPKSGIGWTSWWPVSGPKSCFVGASSLECGANPALTAVLDPQVGWEQQKFLIAWTLMYLPENEQQNWLKQLNIWEIGADTDPGFDGRIELHDPSGHTYVARTFGTEKIFNKTVQKGISARMLEYANELMDQAYVTTPGPVLGADNKPLWHLPVLKADGTPIVKYDPTVQAIDAAGRPLTNGRPGCDANSNLECSCTSNRACLAFNRYVELPFFMRQAMRAYGLANPSMRGIY